MKSKKKTIKYEEGGAPQDPLQSPSLPYTMFGNIAASGVEMFAPNKQTNMGEVDTKAEGAAKGALKGAGTGAAIGSIIPGVGTLVGAGVGALIGGIGGFKKAGDAQSALFDAESSVMGNYSANPYGTPQAKDGMMPKTPFINIEKGELAVDPTTGEVIEDYDTEMYKPHAKDPKDEWKHNFVPAGGLIIPRKYRERYLQYPDQRSGIIRDVLNKQLDRELYGEDADGNKMSFAEMPDEDVQQYAFGGIDPAYAGADPAMWALAAIPSAPYTTAGPVNQVQPPSIAGDVLGDMRANMPLPQNRLEINPNPTPFSAGDPMRMPNYFDRATNNRLQSANFNPSDAMASFNSAMGTTQPGQWTVGNTVGSIGTGIAALGPTAVTLMNGIDRDETNPYLGVENAAINELSGVYSRNKADTLARLRRQGAASSSMNRNRSTSFASMLSNQQNILNLMGQNTLSAAMKYDMGEADAISKLRFQGDIYDARGRESMLDRLDRNRDNFHTNLAANLANAGVHTMNMGRTLNQNEVNNILANQLHNRSPYFDYTDQWDLYFKEMADKAAKAKKTD